MTTGTTLSISQKQEKIIEDFQLLGDWEGRYEYIIELGKSLSPLDEKYKTPLHLVKGCQSQVWLHAEVRNGRLYLSADSDAVITKGIIALLIEVLSGQPLEDVRNADLHFIEAIGLKAHLSPTRSNGLLSMIRHIRSYAEHLSEQDNSPAKDMKIDHRQQMIDEIKKVYDPEIPVDIWELGLIYSLDWNPETNVATVVMTLTSPACPVAGSLPAEVQERLLTLSFINDVDLSLVWNPPWTKDRMSDEARMALDMF
jgi:cysteine desulfuration protein SufE